VSGTKVEVRAAGIERTVVEEVRVHPIDPVKVVSVRPDRRWQRRPRCGVCRQRAPLYDRGRRRRWRSLDDGLLTVFLEADLPRVSCPEHGVVIAAMSWARHGAGHTIRAGTVVVGRPDAAHHPRTREDTGMPGGRW